MNKSGKRRKERVAATCEDSVVIEPTSRHTHTVILLHGLYCRGDDFQTLPEKMIELFGPDFEPMKGIKYIFPNAPIRTISWPDGPESDVPSWYNYFTCKCGEEEDDEIDMSHWHQVSNKIHDLIAEEVANLGDPGKIILGGNSQGGTIACNVALTSEHTLGALFILRSCLLSYTKVNPDWNQLPVYIFNAELDSTFIPALTSKRFQQFDDRGFSTTTWVEKDLRHEDESVCELLFSAKWIGKVFFDANAEVTTKDRPNGPSPEEDDEAGDEEDDGEDAEVTTKDKRTDHCCCLS